MRPTVSAASISLPVRGNSARLAPRPSPLVCRAGLIVDGWAPGQPGGGGRSRQVSLMPMRIREGTVLGLSDGLGVAVAVAVAVAVGVGDGDTPGVGLDVGLPVTSSVRWGGPAKAMLGVMTMATKRASRQCRGLMRPLRTARRYLNRSFRSPTSMPCPLRCLCHEQRGGRTVRTRNEARLGVGEQVLAWRYSERECATRLEASPRRRTATCRGWLGGGAGAVHVTHTHCPGCS